MGPGEVIRQFAVGVVEWAAMALVVALSAGITWILGA